MFITKLPLFVYNLWTYYLRQVHHVNGLCPVVNITMSNKQRAMSIILICTVVHYTIFTVVSLDFVTRVLLLHHFLALIKKKHAYASRTSCTIITSMLFVKLHTRLLCVLGGVFNILPLFFLQSTLNPFPLNPFPLNPF